MNKIWAPWRIEYIRQPKDEGCIFCDKPQGGDDREMLILERGEFSFVLMNLYPYNNNHLMIAPYEHVDDPLQISQETKSEVMAFADKSMTILKKLINPDGFNFGANFGASAGAGIEEHIHYHLVPRWQGDTNFMPVLGHTKVLVQGLQESYDEMKPEFDNF
ncbi:MAG: HIT domain-containing protein [Candidatus Marinimicrobia bacterium]|jgi:ATP adenylyltransferase|nr:HIT domain-containing protein [Candidatus Neomarinimicrobiota bacterium]|tara:strand:- start:149 stop:631 length:483 start_codon:yes stop_codon:yes gene_type:complete